MEIKYHPTSLLYGTIAIVFYLRAFHMQNEVAKL